MIFFKKIKDIDLILTIFFIFLNINKKLTFEKKEMWSPQYL